MSARPRNPTGWRRWRSIAAPGGRRLRRTQDCRVVLCSRSSICSPPKSSEGDRPPVVAPAFAPNTGTVEITGQTAWQPISGEVLGVIEFFSRDPRERDEDQLAMLNVIGGQIGQFLKRKRAEAELRRSEQELRARQEMLDLAQTAAGAVAFDWYIGARESENRWSPELEAIYGLEPGTFDRTYRRLEEAHPSRRLAGGKARDQARARIRRCRGRVPGDSQGRHRPLVAGERSHVLRRRRPTASAWWAS